MLLVLAAAAAHAGWNRLVHAHPDRLATLGVGALVGALLLLPVTLTHPPSGVWRLVLLSGVVQACYSVLLAAAYARGALGVVYPLGRGSAPLLVTLGSVAVLGQRPTTSAAAGALALAAGLALVAGVARRRGQSAAAWFALATGASIAGYSLIDALAVRSASAAGYLGATLLVQGVLLCGLCAGRPRRIAAVLRPGAAVGVGVVAAYLLVLLAFQRADAGRVATLREVSVLIALALSADRRRPALWVGGGLVVLGGVLAVT